MVGSSGSSGGRRGVDSLVRLHHIPGTRDPIHIRIYGYVQSIGGVPIRLFPDCGVVIFHLAVPCMLPNASMVSIGIHFGYWDRGGVGTYPVQILWCIEHGLYNV